VGVHSDRFGREVGDNTEEWEAWLIRTLGTLSNTLESLVLNIPIHFTSEVSTALEACPQCVVHVRFLDAGHFKDPWHGFCEAQVRKCVIHYVPALEEETVTGLNVLCASLKKYTTDRLDITQALCVSYKYARGARDRVEMDTNQPDALLDDDGGVAAYNWLVEALSQSKSVASTLLRGLSNALPQELKPMCAQIPAFNKNDRATLPPPQAVVELSHLSAYFTVKYLSNRGVTILKEQLFNNIYDNKICTLLQKDLDISYEDHIAHIVLHLHRPWVYTPGSLLVTDTAGSTEYRHNVSSEPSHVHNISRAMSSTIDGRPEDFAYTFSHSETLPNTAYIVSLSPDLTPRRLQQLKKVDGEYIVQPTTGMASITETIHLLTRTLVRCMMLGHWRSLLASSPETSQVVCFVVDKDKSDNSTLRMLTIEQSRQLSVLKQVPLFQRLIQALKRMVDHLSTKLNMQKVLAEKRAYKIMRNVLYNDMVPKRVRELVRILSTPGAPFVSVSNMVKVIRERMQKLFRTLKHTLRRKRRSASTPATTNGGTRKRPTHRPRHRRRPPASTQRQRLAKRTRRRNHSAALSPALRSA